MGACIENTKKFFDGKGLHYEVLKDGKALRVGFGGLKNREAVKIIIIFDDSDRTVAIRAFDLCKIPADKVANLYETCSDLNKQFRWIKFYVDKSDNTINAANDAVVSPDTVGSEVYELVMRTCNIVDEAYPELMKAMWA